MRALWPAICIGVAYLLQVCVLGQVAGSTHLLPDPLLLAVLAIGFGRGRAAGAAAGFVAGLLLDLGPEAFGLVGVGAAAAGIVGYSTGLLGEGSLLEHRRTRMAVLVALGFGGVVLRSVLQHCVGWISGIDAGWALPSLIGSAIPTAVAAPIVVPLLSRLLRA